MIKFTGKFLREHPWLLSLIIVAFVAIPGFVRVEQINNREHDNINCVREWADEIVKQSAFLRAINSRRSEALDKVVRSAASANREQLIKDINDYVKVSDEYEEALKDNPIPESPKLTCN